MKTNIYTHGKLKFWVCANKVTVKMNMQYIRYDIYTTANKRNFYTFKKELISLLDSGESITFYDILRLGRENRITGVSASKPPEEEPSE